MRSLKLFVLFSLSIVSITSAQHLKNIDEIGDFSEDLVAIRKDNSWGFIDINGTLIIDFRKNLVTSSNQSPIFSNGLCLIVEKREDIVYYGYMNTKGETIIPTEYIAATSFENGFARVIKHYKTDTGDKNILGKNTISYSYNELIIDTKNEFVLLITGPHHLLFDKLKSQQNIPAIRSTFISDYLIAVKEDNNAYSIHNLKK